VRIAGALAGGVAIAVAVVLLVERGHHDPVARLPTSAIQVDVGAGSAGVRIPPGFVGLSTEYSSLTAYAGRNPNAINPMFVTFVRNLSPGAAPVIRFGGDTTDWTWWPQAGASKPPWARYVLTPLWFAIARGLALAARARLILGINFEADSRTLAGTESRALLDGIGRRLIAAFELGNEPEVYGEIGWYAGPRGTSVLGRPRSYGVRSYLRDFRRISAALPPAVPLAGPALALTWPLTVAGRFLTANPRVRLFTFHFYPLKRCFNTTSSPTYPTLAHLLAPRSAAPPAGLEAAVRAAHSRGVAIRADEVNSVSCEGLPGLSDSFASALWILDELFGLAQAGVDGVNIHTLPHVSYEPFSFSRPAGRWQARVEPLYYGLLLFARAAPAGSELLATSHRADAALQTWATRDSRRTVRVVLINESPDRRLTLAVRAPGPTRSATLEWMEAPGLTATSGVTLAGQSYGSVTTTGRLVGRRRAISLEPVRGRYVVSLAPASAALLTVRELAHSASSH
jgi:hypothetical protein